MKLAWGFILSIFFIGGCTQSQPAKQEAGEPRTGFFPVTSYIKGQLLEIRNRGINPLKYITINGKTDSAWIKMDSLEKEFREFLTPEIDSVNLIEYFKETKFNDLTTNAYTFTYDPLKALPDTFSLSHWDIYIDPEKNTVRKIYWVKKYANHTTAQLTWYHDKYCKIIYFSEEKNNKPTILKEERITWDF